MSWVKSVCYTARTFGAEEALQVGLVSEIADTKAAAVEKALSMAKTIAEKSPIAVQGTKNIMDYSRDHKIDEGLTYTAGKYLNFDGPDLVLTVFASMECCTDAVGRFLQGRTFWAEETETDIREAVVHEVEPVLYFVLSPNSVEN